MKIILSSRRHHYVVRMSIALIAVALIAGMVGCGGPAEAPVISSFTANPGSINIGDSSTLSWSVSDATDVSIDQGIGPVAASGTRTVSPSVTTTYTVTASNSAGSSTGTATVTVIGPPVISSFTANPEFIGLGGTSTLSWSVSGATEVSIDQGIGLVAATGTRTVSPTRHATYTLTASNSAGSQTASVQVQMQLVYDFVAQASHSRTKWWSACGELEFPGAETDDRGFARYVTNAVLENNVGYDRVLETHPQWVNDGYIRAVYFEPLDLGYNVEAGDHFRAEVGFLKNASLGNVRFLVTVVTDDLAMVFAVITEVYDGALQTIDIDLSPYANTNARASYFLLEVQANGLSSQDWAVWATAKIVHDVI